MNNIEQIWRFHEFRRLWFIGLASGSARWIEVLCFSVFAWKITNDATVAGWLMTSRMSGVMLAGTLFTVFGGRHSGQLVMITIYGLCARFCYPPARLFIFFNFSFFGHWICFAIYSFINFSEHAVLTSKTWNLDGNF